MLNRCLDDAIAGAVTEYGRARNQSTLDGETARGSERIGFFAHELRNLINTAIVSFEVLKTGNVGVAGSSGAVLHRSLMGRRGADRTDLGLAFGRWGIEANSGRISARSLTGRGCVFTIDLPRLPVPAVAMV